MDTGVVPGQCNKVADGFDNRVSSLLMDAGLICTVYCEAGCEGGKSAVLETQNNPNFATMTNMVSSHHRLDKTIPDIHLFRTTA